MIRKFFPLDKNYLLEDAQLHQQQPLLTALIKNVKSEYSRRNNPLGLEDAFSKKIHNYVPDQLDELSRFYLALAGVYRYKYGHNQLEMLWDGESHYEKYRREWATMFQQWTNQFCAREQFVQAVLDLTVFRPRDGNVAFAENRMNFVMQDFFELKIHKIRGIVVMKIA